jgi:sec-independent protein translocase protein TatC
MKNQTIHIENNTVENNQDQPRPFLEHVAELRSLVIWTILWFFITSLLAYAFSDEIFSILVYPFQKALAAKDIHRRLIYTNLTEAFVVYVKVAVFTGFFVTFPFLFLQVWRFVSPGLFKNERRLFFFLLLAIPILFVLGALFAYSVVLPTAFGFFLSFENSYNSVPLQLEAKISEYLSLVMRLLLAFGFCFQLPALLIGLSTLGIIKSQQLIKRWRIAVVLVVAISAVITPPDALSMILLAVPLLVLYTLTIFSIHYLEKRKKHA